MILCDTNILLDIATNDPVWRGWSEKQVALASAQGRVLINPIIYSELSLAFATKLELDRWLDPLVFKNLDLPYAAAWVAGRAFIKYRRSGGAKSSPLPDFYIGAHAEVENYVVVTRDPNRYRTYFPTVELITPP